MIEAVVREENIVVTVQGQPAQIVKTETPTEMLVVLSTEHYAIIAHRPEIFYGQGAPPSAANLENGSLYFKY